MSVLPINPLPLLTLADFGPGTDHIAETYLGGKIFAILHKDDPARTILPLLHFDASDLYTYVFVHGASSSARFENSDQPTFEIPVAVAAQLVKSQFGPNTQVLVVRLCACNGNLSRPGESSTLAQLFVRELCLNSLESYHGLILANAGSRSIRLGLSVEWDPHFGQAVVIGPPGDWESVLPWGILMDIKPTILLRPVVHFCEYPFGTSSEPSMREFMTDSPRENQDNILVYMRSGAIFGYPIGGRARDPFDRGTYADALVDGQLRSCCTEMSDGVWFWYAGLIYFVAKYNVKLPDEFIEHAARNGWWVDRDALPHANYECDYFAPAAR